MWCRTINQTRCKWPNRKWWGQSGRQPRLNGDCEPAPLDRWVALHPVSLAARRARDTAPGSADRWRHRRRRPGNETITSLHVKRHYGVIMTSFCVTWNCIRRHWIMHAITVNGMNYEASFTRTKSCTETEIWHAFSQQSSLYSNIRKGMRDVSLHSRYGVNIIHHHEILFL